MSKLASNKVYRLLSAGVIVLSIASAFFIFFWRQNVTEVSTQEGLCYFTEPEFQLRWIHSVEKQSWEEWYQNKSTHLLLTKTYFKAFGAGTPSTEQLETKDKPGFIGYRINRDFTQLNWVVSRLTKGELLYGGHDLLIYQWVPDYSEVVIAPKSYSVIDILKKDYCHDYSPGRTQQ